MFNKKSLFALSALALIMCGCEKNNGMIVDWSPVNIEIYATDSQGNSIISPDMPGMTLTFQGETYTVQDGPMHTKAYLAQMYGLYTQAIDTTASPRQYKLCFGDRRDPLPLLRSQRKQNHRKTHLETQRKKPRRRHLPLYQQIKRKTEGNYFSSVSLFSSS